MVENVLQMSFSPHAESSKDLLLSFPYVDVCIAVKHKFVRGRRHYVTSFLRGLLLLPAGTAVLCQAREYLEGTAGPVSLD